MLRDSPQAEVVNDKVPGDRTISESDQHDLEQGLEPLVDVLRLLGYAVTVATATPAPLDPEPTKEKRRSPTRHDTTLADLFHAGLTHEGMRLCLPDKPGATATIGPEGGIVHRGVERPNPNKATEYELGGGNGWEKWVVVDHPDGAVRLIDLRARYAAARANKEQTA